MMRKPIPTAWLILMNSRLSAAIGLARGYHRTGGLHTLGALADEERTLADEVLWDIGKFLDGVRHDEELRRARDEEDKTGEEERSNPSQTIWPSGGRDQDYPARRDPSTGDIEASVRPLSSSVCLCSRSSIAFFVLGLRIPLLGLCSAWVFLLSPLPTPVSSPYPFYVTPSN